MKNLEKGNNVLISNYTSESVKLSQQYHYDINWIKILDNNLLLPDYIISINTTKQQLTSYLDSLISSSNCIKITSDDSEEVIRQCINKIQQIYSLSSSTLSPIQKINFKPIKEFDYSSFSSTHHKDGEKRGMFIVFEGCDRSGKSTQVDLLKQYFKKSNLKFEHFIFPDRTTIIGKCINKFLSKELTLNAHSIHMLFAANRWEIKSQLENCLYSGTNIIVDRYAFSGIVYSSAKHIPDMSLNWCINPDCGIPQPDLIIFMDIKPSICSNRAEFGNEVYETNAFQQEVYQQFKLLFKGYANILNVDASQSIDAIHNVIKHTVMSKINEIQKKVILPITPTSS